MKNAERSAFTLLELIYAFAIFTAVIVSTLVIVHTCTKLNREAIERIRALAIAESRMEIMRDHISSCSDVRSAAVADPSDEQLSTLRDGDVRVEVEDYEGESSGLVLVRVIVSWKSGRRTLSVKLSTLCR